MQVISNKSCCNNAVIVQSKVENDYKANISIWQLFKKHFLFQHLNHRIRDDRVQTMTCNYLTEEWLHLSALPPAFKKPWQPDMLSVTQQACQLLFSLFVMLMASEHPESSPIFGISSLSAVGPSLLPLNRPYLISLCWYRSLCCPPSVPLLVFKNPL